jgi:hypothetical protein
MEIYINNEQIPFELENEENCLDVINAIEEFAQSSKPKQFITNIYINDEEVSFADEEGLRSRSLDQVERLEVSTADIQGITLLSIYQIEKFLGILAGIFADETWDDSLENLAESMSWMRDGVQQVVTIFGNGNDFLSREQMLFSTSFDHLEHRIIELTSGSVEYNQVIREECSRKTDKLIEIIAEIKDKISTIFTEPGNESMLQTINTLITDIDTLIPRLSNVPFLFQSGEDKESMAVIQDLTMLLENSIKIFSHFKDNFTINMDKETVKEVSFEEFFQTMTDHLKELMDSIENNDSVMIGDLLEYEFVPNLEEISKLLEKLKAEAYTRAN